MPAAAPRIDHRLLATLAHVYDESLPIAEVNRRVGAVAFESGLTKPSYEQVRVLVHALRRELARRRRRTGPTTAEILLDVMFQARPPEAIFDHLGGVGVPWKPK